MIGNRVRLIMVNESGPFTEITGVLHELAAGKGATVRRENVMPEGESKVFVPMHRIYEIVDLGRAL